MWRRTQASLGTKPSTKPGIQAIATMAPDLPREPDTPPLRAQLRFLQEAQSDAYENETAE